MEILYGYLLIAAITAMAFPFTQSKYWRANLDHEKVGHVVLSGIFWPIMAAWIAWCGLGWLLVQPSVLYGNIKEILDGKTNS